MAFEENPFPLPRMGLYGEPVSPRFSISGASSSRLATSSMRDRANESPESRTSQSTGKTRRFFQQPLVTHVLATQKAWRPQVSIYKSLSILGGVWVNMSEIENTKRAHVTPPSWTSPGTLEAIHPLHETPCASYSLLKYTFIA